MSLQRTFRRDLQGDMKPFREKRILDKNQRRWYRSALFPLS